MVKQNKQQKATNRITKATKNSIQVDLRLKAIQEDACINLLSEMYDKTVDLSNSKWPYGICSFVIGAGFSGIIQWVAGLKDISKSTFGTFWDDNHFYLLLIIVGIIIWLVLFLMQKRKLLSEKNKILDHYLNSEKWGVVSQPTSLTLNNNTFQLGSEPQSKK